MLNVNLTLSLILNRSLARLKYMQVMEIKLLIKSSAKVEFWISNPLYVIIVDQSKPKLFKHFISIFCFSTKTYFACFSNIELGFEFGGRAGVITSLKPHRVNIGCMVWKIQSGTCTGLSFRKKGQLSSSRKNRVIYEWEWVSTPAADLWMY